MSNVRGHVRNGKLEIDGPLPADWPEGMVFTAQSDANAAEWGITEDEWPTTPEEIEAWCAWAESLEPIFLTPDEQAEFDRVLAEQKAWELANWKARNKKIEGLFP